MIVNELDYATLIYDKDEKTSYLLYSSTYGQKFVKHFADELHKHTGYCETCASIGNV